jgi:hypothetical protein
MSPDLHDLVAPAPRPRFREELWERAQEQERSAARRWRLVAIAAVVVAAAAVSGAAGVLAHTEQAAVTVDRTIACPVPVQGGVPVFHLYAQARGKMMFRGKLQTSAAQTLVTVGDNGVATRTDYAAVTSFAGGFSMDSRICRAAPRASFDCTGLKKDADYLPNQAGLGGLFGARCFSGTAITIRLRARTSPSGAPVWARLVVRTGKKQRAVAYVDWTPDKVTPYLSGDCFP